MSTLTGMCTAVMGVIEQQGETIRSASAGEIRIVCARRGELVFVSVGYDTCEAYLARELEFAYEAMLMALTSRVHKVLSSSPGYDVGELLGSTGTVLSRLEALGRTGPELLLGAVRCMRLEPSCRSQLTHVLTTARKISGSASPGCERLVLGAALCGDAVLSVLEPAPTQERSVRSTDVLLLANYVHAQRAALIAAESSWFPLCLPRFEERGYLHANVTYLDANLDICLVLVAADDKPDTFATLRNVAKAVENALDRDGVLSELRSTVARDHAARAADAIANAAQAEHFVLARRRPLAAAPPKDNAAHCELSVAQCLASSVIDGHPSPYPHYHHLALRLRYGSSQPQHTLTDDPSAKAHDVYEKPLPTSILYSTIDARTYFALSGPSFELYASFASLATAKELSKRTQSILRHIQSAEASFFFDPVTY